MKADASQAPELMAIEASGRRRSRQEAAAVRAAIADGQEIAFTTRHQWRHYHKRRPV